jgi:hypothetical protein
LKGDAIWGGSQSKTVEGPTVVLAHLSATRGTYPAVLGLQTCRHIFLGPKTAVRINPIISIICKRFHVLRVELSNWFIRIVLGC